MIRAEKLTVARGGRHVVCDLDLSVVSGDFLVVAGPNGAGKTSLLRTLSGELAAAAGRVFLDGRPVRDYAQTELARRRAFLAQQTECRLPFTCEEIVMLGAEAAGLRGAIAHQMVGESMTLAGVEGFARRVISQLSGGEQQRVHWARTLAQIGPDPAGRLVFLDEPVSSLDLEHQHALLRTAAGLAHRGAAVVSVLHDLNLTAAYAGRVLLLNESRVVAEGTPAEVFTPERIGRVFNVRASVVPQPPDGRPLVIVDPQRSGTGGVSG
ncbi:MAG: heme ABC transporter ATP-binding protein [Terrimicrobiaceae bacterium]|nr:heme ABC transporter ATP-binding protein [Terrimicrobiaceae bacterium]